MLVLLIHLCNSLKLLSINLVVIPFVTVVFDFRYANF